jgi:hypothetical protein
LGPKTLRHSAALRRNSSARGSGGYVRWAEEVALAEACARQQWPRACRPCPCPCQRPASTLRPGHSELPRKEAWFHCGRRPFLSMRTTSKWPFRAAMKRGVPLLGSAESAGLVLVDEHGSKKRRGQGGAARQPEIQAESLVTLWESCSTAWNWGAQARR